MSAQSEEKFRLNAEILARDFLPQVIEALRILHKEHAHLLMPDLYNLDGVSVDEIPAKLRSSDRYLSDFRYTVVKYDPYSRMPDNPVLHQLIFDVEMLAVLISDVVAGTGAFPNPNRPDNKARYQEAMLRAYSVNHLRVKAGVVPLDRIGGIPSVASVIRQGSKKRHAADIEKIKSFIEAHT